MGETERLSEKGTAVGETEVYPRSVDGAAAQVEEGRQRGEGIVEMPTASQLRDMPCEEVRDLAGEPVERIERQWSGEAVERRVESGERRGNAAESSEWRGRAVQRRVETGDAVQWRVERAEWRGSAVERQCSASRAQFSTCIDVLWSAYSV